MSAEKSSWGGKPYIHLLSSQENTFQTPRIYMKPKFRAAVALGRKAGAWWRRGAQGCKVAGTCKVWCEGNFTKGPQKSVKGFLQEPGQLLNCLHWGDNSQALVEKSCGAAES